MDKETPLWKVFQNSYLHLNIPLPLIDNEKETHY